MKPRRPWRKMQGLTFITIVPSSEGMKENNDGRSDYFS